jgi:GNAT superfamily N-acetyltransferase
MIDASTKELPSGIRIRAPHLSDAPDVADLMRACDIASYGEPDTDLNDVLDDWNAPHFDLARDAFILERAGGPIVGFAGTRPRARADFDASFYVRPGEPVAALAPALIEAVEGRVREAGGGIGETVSLGFFIGSVEKQEREVLERMGYRDARIFFRMRIDLEPPPTPASPAPGLEGIEIRALRLGMDDRVFHATLEESFAEHFRHFPRTFDEWWALRTKHARFDPGLCLLAWDGERAAGALFAYDYGDLGFIRELGVLKPWRGRGLGAAFLRRSFENFRSRGQLKVVLGVDAENESAVVLYERVGMRQEQRHHLMQKRLSR